MNCKRREATHPKRVKCRTRVHEGEFGLVLDFLLSQRNLRNHLRATNPIKYRNGEEASPERLVMCSHPTYFLFLLS